jgi:hypothetical protein
MEWARQLQTDQPLPPAAFEPGLYLIPAYEGRKEAIELQQQGYDEIMCLELEAWSTDPESLARLPQPGSEFRHAAGTLGHF